MGKFLLLLLSVSLAGSTSLFAQHQHTTNPDTVIDGAKHPELVPDSTAYRLFFFTVGEKPDPTPERRARQEAILAPINLTESELDVVISILDQFKQDYAEQVNEYNSDVNIANQSGVPPDLKGFLRQRDLLVQTTRDNISSALTKPSLVRFEAHIRAEKRHMTVDKEVQ